MQPAGGQISLNGTSSSGKSSIAAELLRILDAPYFHLSVDAFNAMRARRDLAPEQLEIVLERTVLGFHRAVAGMAAAGNDMVVDHVLRERSSLLDCLTLFAPYDVVFVGVRCPLSELERRERARDDRQPGRAAYQFDRVHSHGLYDVECDTSTRTPRDCAAQISSFVREQPTIRAFERLRQAHLD